MSHYYDLFGGEDPDAILRLCLKIVSSHGRRHFEYLRLLINTVQRGLSRLDRLDIFSIDSIEKQWSDNSALSKRVAKACSNLEAIMIQCRVPLTPPNTRELKRWDDVEVDLQAVYFQFQDIRRRVKSLAANITGLAGLAGNRQALVEQTLSRQEARSVKALTLVGLIFIPLGYTAALFGMQQPYGPLDGQFWTHFAVSLPLVVIVLSTYYLLQFVQREDREVCHEIIRTGLASEAANRPNHLWRVRGA
jgi:hypothetical protein